MQEEKSDNYISLQKATEYCSYTQEYLSLRARQGKLKAVKIGRNWLTKKEWVKEYVERVEEYNNNNLKANNLKAKKLVPPPRNLPIERITRVSSFQLRPALAMVLVFVLLTAGIVSGKESLKNVYENISPLLIDFSQNFDRGAANLSSEFRVQSSKFGQDLSSYTYIVGQAGDIIIKNTTKLLSETISDIPHSLVNVSETIDNTQRKIILNLLPVSTGLAQVTSPDVLKSTLNTFKEFGQWLTLQSRAVLNGVKSFAQGLKEIPQAVTGLFKKEIAIEKPKEEFAEIGEIEKLQEELKKLKEKPAKEITKEVEVSRITKIEPIKEITKETRTLDDESLKKIQATLLQQETDVGKLKLTASRGYINFPATVGPSGAVSLTTLGTITQGTWQASSIEDAYVVDDLTITSQTFSAAGGYTLKRGTEAILAVDANGAVDINARGTDQNITLTPSGTGSVVIMGSLSSQGSPTLPHTFISWSPGVADSNVANATVYVNPATAVADSNLLGLAVGGSVKLLVDAEGDIFVNNLTAAGSVNVGATTISTLTVENNTTLGDATTDTLTINPAILTWAGGDKTIDITGAATRTLTLLNSTAGQVADLDLSDGSLKTAGTSRLTNLGLLENITGLTSSGTITFSGLTADRPVITTTGGQLTTEAQLAIARGGTAGTASPTAGAIAYGTGSAYAFSAAGTTDYALISGGTGAPTWTNTPSWSTITLSTSVTTPLLTYAGGALTIQTQATAGADDIIFQLAGDEKLRIEEDGDLFFEKGANDVTIQVTAPAAARIYTIPDFGADVSFVGTNRSISTTLPLAGGGDLSANRTLTIGGLSSLGTANYLVGANAAADAWEYKQLLGVASETDITHGVGSVTVGLVDPLILSKGGTSKSLTASNGGIVYTDSDSMEILDGTAIAGQILRSGASSVPSWSTATYPATATGTGTILRADGTNWVATTTTYPTTTTINRILYSSSADVIGEITTANSGVLVTSSTGVPSILGSMTNGQLVIGSTGATPVLATLTATTDQITVTNAAGSITLSTPQSIATSSFPQFARMGLGVAAHATDILTITSTDTTASSKALNITHSGVITGTGYAGYFSKTGGSTTNVGLYATASGATNNYAAIFEAGDVGIGTTGPTEKLTIRQDSVGNLLGLYDGANNTILAINDGGVATFKPSAFDTVYNFDGGTTYTDNTSEAKTSAGTAFTILALEASSNDEFYLGLDHPFNTVYIDIAVAGAGVTLSAQYYSTTWSALTITDNTTNLTVDGTITFTAPSDWATTAVNGVTKYWIRLRSPATNITTAPTAYSVSPTTGNRFYVYGQSGDTAPALYINDKGNVGIGTTAPGRKLDVLYADSTAQLRLSQTSSVYTEFYVAPTTGDLTISLYPNSSANDIILNMPGGSTGANLWVCEGDTCPSVTLSSGGNIVVEGDIKYPSTAGARRSIILTSSGAIPPTTGGTEKTQVDGTNHSYYVLDFDAASDEASYWQWAMPDSYNDGTINITYYWIAAATTGNVVWCFQARGASTGEAIDAALSTAVCETAAAPGVANTLAATTESTAASNFTKGEYITFKVFRDADNAADTMTGDARLVKVKIEYGVSQESD